MECENEEKTVLSTNELRSWCVSSGIGTNITLSDLWADWVF